MSFNLDILHLEAYGDSDVTKLILNVWPIKFVMEDISTSFL